jgi:hypothetical protein
MIGSTATRLQRNFFFATPGTRAPFVIAGRAHLLKNNETRRVRANDPQPFHKSLWISL